MQAVCAVADVVQVVCILREGRRNTVYGGCFAIEQKAETD